MLTSDSSYTKENFSWLMQNQSIKTYLSRKNLDKTITALESDNEDYLKKVYPVLLELFLTNKRIDENYEQTYNQMIENITTEINTADKQEKEEIQARNNYSKESDEEEADNILKKLDQ